MEKKFEREREAVTALKFHIGVSLGGTVTLAVLERLILVECLHHADINTEPSKAKVECWDRAKLSTYFRKNV